MLAALAAGTATSAQVIEVRPHLRHCMACRATVRDLHISRRRRVQLLLPPVLLGGWPFRRRGGDDSLPEPEGLAEALLSDGGELVTPAHADPSWLAHWKHELGAWLHRANSSDVATGIHIASNGGGGGRIGAFAAILGFCVSSLGAGTVCVISGVVPSPLTLLPERVEPDRPRPEPAPARKRPPVVVAASIRASEAVVPTPTPTPSHERQVSETDPSQRRTPKAHREAPISPVAESATTEFSLEQADPRTQPDPAPAPATGGTEFTP